MGCLVEIVFTEKASEKPDLFFFLKYKKFFCGANVVSMTEKDKYINGKYFSVNVYVHWPENRASQFCVNVISHDSQVRKATLIS